MTGIIIKLTPRGFGFIREDGKPESDKGVFFHSENVVGTTYNELREGEAVTFEMTDGPKGPSAVNVQRA